MTHQYKTSYKTYRNVNRFHVDLPYPNGDPLPDSEYWENQANQRLLELMDIVGDEQARTMTNHIIGTWREVHDAIKDLVKAQAQSDPRIVRRESILAALREEPLSKSEAHELYSELAEIDQALQFNPSDTCQAYISAAFEKMAEVEF